MEMIFINFFLLFVIIIFMLVIFVFSAMRSSKRLMSRKPKNLNQIYSKLDIEKVMKSIIEFARISKLEIDHFDEEKV